MSALGPYAAFIVSAYVLVLVVIAGLVLWVISDHRAQQRRLASLGERSTRRGKPEARE